jgi:ABC-2 type transport system ATP-binding protein
MTTPVALDAVSVFYGEVVGLSHVTLALAPGITGIVGPNGSGKSTLMRVVTGLVRPREGTARVLGGDPFASADIRARIAFVPATENFHDGLSGRNNARLVATALGLSPRDADARADRALEVAGLVADGRRAYGTWSRGMRQRLKLGWALSGEAPLVLLDEPFLGVDPPSRRQLVDLVRRLGAEGRTVLVTSHVLSEIETLTDRVAVLAHGRLLGFGHLAELLKSLRDRHPHRVRLETSGDPRPLGRELLLRPDVLEVRVTGERAIEFVTARPETIYRELPALVAATGTGVRRLHAPDDTLEAVFRHVTEGGTRRL